MRKNPFSQLLETREEDERKGGVTGLWFAEVHELDEEGYILKWLSGSVGSLSAPARVATLMAGNERGAFFMPEKGDEVVVGFEEGDLDQPVILGALWSDTDVPPENADTEPSNNIRTIVSRSGHQITFDDSPGAGKVTIQSNGELQIILDDASAGGNITIQTPGNLKIILDDAAGSITLEATSGNKIEISSSGVNVTGSQINLN